MTSPHCLHPIPLHKRHTVITKVFHSTLPHENCGNNPSLFPLTSPPKNPLHPSYKHRLKSIFQLPSVAKPAEINTSLTVLQPPTKSSGPLLIFYLSLPSRLCHLLLNPFLRTRSFMNNSFLTVRERKHCAVQYSPRPSISCSYPSTWQASKYLRFLEPPHNVTCDIKMIQATLPFPKQSPLSMSHSSSRPFPYLHFLLFYRLPYLCYLSYGCTTILLIR